MWLLQLLCSQNPGRIEFSLGCRRFEGIGKNYSVSPRNLPGNSICENWASHPSSSSFLRSLGACGHPRYAVSVLPPPNSPSLGELQLFSSQCSEPQKLLHIAQELLHTEETYVKRLHLLDQVTLPAWSLALSTSRVSIGSFRGKLYILALARPCSWNMPVMNTKTWTYLSLLQKFLVFAFTTFGSGAKVLSSHLGGFSSWQLNYLSR